jgi:hypothetical protein
MSMAAHTRSVTGCHSSEIVQFTPLIPIAFAIGMPYPDYWKLISKYSDILIGQVFTQRAGMPLAMIRKVTEQRTETSSKHKARLIGEMKL